MDLEKFVNDNKKYLQEDNITNITKHKIKYVSNYIENWTYIMCEHNKINTIILLIVCVMLEYIMIVLYQLPWKF